MINELLLALPEIYLLSMACFILLIDVFLNNRSVTFWLTQLTLLVTLVLILSMLQQGFGIAFNNAFISDKLSVILKAAVCVLTAIALLYSRADAEQKDVYNGEYYCLGLFAVLGMMVMISGAHLLSIYLGLELLSLSLYAMVALNRDSPMAAEAATKYFILGAIASGMLLYGISMLYGATGALDLPAISAALFIAHEQHWVLVFGLCFIVVGIAFKLGVAPFHMWVPDVYQGAPTAVTVFIGAAPKIAGYAMLIRVLVDGLAALHADWQGMLVILAVLSLALGNIAAIAQQNIKRLLAYSTIAHMGFVLLGVAVATDAGYAAALFYSLVYALMTLGGFGMILLLNRRMYAADSLAAFKGLNQRNPWYAVLMLIIMFSMAGVPPLVGFHAKLAVLRAVLAVGWVELAVFAMLMSVIGAFYYLRVVKYLYFDQAEDVMAIHKGADFKLVLSLNSLAVLGLGIYPSGLIALCFAVFA